MSRYTGPKVKVLRALGTALPGLTAKKLERRPYPPGQHGQARRKLSEYGLRLREKQKLRLNYGVTECQMLSLVKEARASKLPTGYRLLQLLEVRLDNIVFRAGFARTIPQARQKVRHGHVQVDGRRVNIPSYRVRVGQVVALAQPQKLPTTAGEPAYPTDWLKVSESKTFATVTDLPGAESSLFPVDLKLVVEFYSQKL